MNKIALLLMCGGLFFLISAAVGALRLPDFYTRLHATGQGDTLGIALFVLGLAVYHGFNYVSLKLLLIAAAFFVASPIGGHVLTRAAYHAGLKPWTKKEE